MGLFHVYTDPFESFLLSKLGLRRKEDSKKSLPDTFVILRMCNSEIPFLLPVLGQAILRVLLPENRVLDAVQRVLDLARFTLSDERCEITIHSSFNPMLNYVLRFRVTDPGETTHCSLCEQDTFL